MVNMRNLWRPVAVLSTVAVALAMVTAAFAQAPPSPPHQFFGSVDTGSSAMLDGEAAADGSVVTAWNESAEAVGTDAIEAGTWSIQVSADDAASVTFSIDGSSQSDSSDVSSGLITEVALDVTSGDGDGDGVSASPTGLPNTGTGGLADVNGGLPTLALSLALAVMVALGGVAATRRVMK